MDKTEKIVSAIPSAAELEQLAELHKAMGDHTRMRILWHLTRKEYCVSDLAKEIGVTESALSHQLRALRIVRLVRSRKEGKKVIYSLQDEHIGWVLEETYTGDVAKGVAARFKGMGAGMLQSNLKLRR